MGEVQATREGRGSDKPGRAGKRHPIALPCGFAACLLLSIA